MRSISVFSVRLRRSQSSRLPKQYLSFVETAQHANPLVAEVANAYLTLLADQELLRLTADTLGSQQDS